MTFRILSHRLTAGVAVLLLAVSAVLAEQTAVNGRIEQVGPFKLLRVWGTPEEMGYAHGYLMGEAYLAPAEEYYQMPQHRELEQKRNALLGFVQLPENVRRELRGIFDGIVAAAGKIPVVEGLGRPLEPEDLIFDNAADLFRAFACSGFTVWGDKARNAGLITSRNFDYFVPGPVALQQQMILVREAAGKSKVATITWPGLIIAFTGFNEHGVCAFVHDGNGAKNRNPERKYTPLLLTVTDFLEAAKPDNALQLAETTFKGVGAYPFSYMIRVVAPRGAGAANKPARVFRVDANGFSENPSAELSCITTNHYLDVNLVPAANADGWSLHRYQTLSKRLGELDAADAAWDALRAVANESATLHCLVVFPERHRLDLAMAVWKEKFVPAPTQDPSRITFDQIFAAHE